MDAWEKRTDDTVSSKEEKKEGVEREKRRSAIGSAFKKLLTRERLLVLLKGGLLFALAFLLDRSSWILSARPFGIALLAGAESGLGFIYGGLILSALPIFGDTFRLIAILAATAAVLLRIAVRMTVDLPWKRGDEPEVRPFGHFCASLFREHVALRMAIAAVAVFLTGLYRMISGGYTVYDLLGALLSVTLAPLFTLVFARTWKREVWTFTTLKDFLCGVAAIFAFILSLSVTGVSIYGISAAALLAMGAVLYLTSRCGISHGILAGLALGAAIDPIAAPLYAFGAVTFGALRRMSILLGALSALFVGMAWGFYVYGLSALSLLFPALFVSVLLFCVLERLGFLPVGSDMQAQSALSEDTQVSSQEEQEERVSSEAERTAYEEGDRIRFLKSVLAAERLRDEERKIEDLCGAFLSISDLLGALREDGKYPSAEEYRRVCDRVCDEFCPGCASCAVCWGSDYAEMTEVLGEMSEMLHETGRVEESVLPASLTERCGMRGALLLRINEEAAKLSEDALKRERAGLLSADYSAAAVLFRSASRSAPGAYGIDEEKSVRAQELLLRNGVHAACVAVTGGRRATLYAWNVERRAIERIFADAERMKEWTEMLGFLPAEPIVSVIPGGGGLCDLRVPSAPRYTVRSVSASYSARIAGQESGLCGDSVAFFSNGDGRSFALLSDGMGSGRNAAHLSGICAIFLQKMLSTGGETGVILRMLNDFLAAGAPGESSATVDLLEFDTFTGEAFFWKSGAAPTFVLREGNLLRITARTAPAGILPEMDVQKVSFRLYAGDVVMMVSDGVSESEEDLSTLSFAVNSDMDEAALRRAAERIARGDADAVRSDDRSVILLAVSDAEMSEEKEMPRAV